MATTLLGRPLLVTDEFPGDLEAGDDALIVGDFRQAVYIADKRGIDIQRNDAIGFHKDVTAFRAIMRTDIALAWPDALRILAIKAE
jgi:HK97 family phage major capsid protein